MSNTWYPIIDYDKCTGCLACYENCTNGVYELNTENKPKVVLASGCIQGCKSCAELCPEDAISYLGDTATKDNCCCSQTDESCGCSSDDESCCGETSIGCCGDSDEKTGGCGCAC